MQIDWNKPLQTRGGKEVTIISRAGRGDYPVIYYIGDTNELYKATENGSFYHDKRPSNCDIVNKATEEIVYINVYKNSTGLLYAYPTRERADSGAGGARIACIKVAIKEGQFDE